MLFPELHVPSSFGLDELLVLVSALELMLYENIVVTVKWERYLKYQHIVEPYSWYFITENR